MASNKEKSLSSRKEAIGKRPWPNLPQQILNLLATKPNMLRQLSYPGTTKSWTNTTKRCNGDKHPKWPRLHDCSAKTTDLQHFINISFRIQAYPNWRYCPYSSTAPLQLWDSEMGHFLGFSNGSLVKRGPHGIEFCEMSRGIHWSICGWDADIPFKHAVFSSSSEGRFFNTVKL